MRAAFIRRYGGNEVVEVGDRPDPAVGPGDVLVEVHAAGINPLDFKTRDGALRRIRPFAFPLVLGNELSGVVVARGERAARFQVGDAVFGRVDKARVGCFAERAAVDERELARKPARLTHVEAASLPLAGLTAWQALFDRGRLPPGGRVLVHAGAGGVGSLAIQLAKAKGAWVATTASAANHGLVRGLGADQPIDHRSEDFSTLLRDLDLVLDAVGGPTLARSFRVLRPGGRLVTIAGIPDGRTMAELGAGLPLRLAGDLANLANHLRARWYGVGFGYLFMTPSGPQLEELARLVEAGSLRPLVERSYPLEGVRDALAPSAAGRTRGKLVLDLRCA